MTGLRSIRPLPAASMRGVAPSADVGKAPKVEWVDPREIYVEDAYQRSMTGENSTTLVRRIVAKFNWSRFKPPICVRLPESGNVLVCIDGQHTATAAATHPDVPKIPVLVVTAASAALRAGSFVGHNRDRLALTQMAIYRAELAAGDEVALAVERACRAAGAEVLPTSVDLRKKTAPGKTIAVGALRQIARNDGEDFLARVLSVLVRAGRGPVKAGEVRAAASVLRAEPRRAADALLREVVASRSAEGWAAAAAALTAEHGTSSVDATASLWRDALAAKGAAVAAPPVERKAPAAPSPAERAEHAPRFSGLETTAPRRSRAFDPDAPAAPRSKKSLRDMLREAVENTARLSGAAGESDA